MCCRKLTPLALSNSSHSNCSSTASAVLDDDEEEAELAIVLAKNEPKIQQGSLPCRGYIEYILIWLQ